MVRTLWDILGEVEDRRGPQGRQYALRSVLGISIAATLADRARSHVGTRRRHPDRLDRRGADGAPALGDSDQGMGRRAGRHHPSGVCAGLSGAQLPDPALRAVHRQRSNLTSRPVYCDGQPVQSREAIARRDRLIEKLASLPPVHGALDQIVQRFGADMVAEVKGRSRRIVGKGDRLLVENRAGSANLAETQAFMDDEKHTSSSRTPAVRAAATTPRCRRGTVACGFIISWKPDGRLTPPSRGSGARTGPTRRNRRCSGRSRPT